MNILMQQQYVYSTYSIRMHNYSAPGGIRNLDSWVRADSQRVSELE